MTRRGIAVLPVLLMCGACVMLAAAAMTTAAASQANRGGLAELASRITRDTKWTLAASIPIAFPTYHPQGMVRIGETFYVSSVEVRKSTQRFPSPIDGYDRDPGAGVGHLFKIDRSGKLLADLTIGEDTIYHPGGMDYDGTNIWVPVAEYRPDSKSIVYRVDPASMKATEAFRWADHVGAVVYNGDDQALHGVSWGSRRFYRWRLDGNRHLANAAAPGDAGRAMNPSHYVDYQDCKYAGERRMLCTGVTEMRTSPSAAPFRLGGLELVDLRDGRPLHQVPLLLWTAAGVDMTHNPSWFEAVGSTLRGYFMPEDDASTIYVYEASLPDK
jgi:hypothetical protein